MRLLVGMCAVLITLGAAFDLLIVIDLINRDSLRLSVGTYLSQGPEFVRWVREVLGLAFSEAVVSPVFALPAASVVAFVFGSALRKPTAESSSAPLVIATRLHRST